MDKMNYTTIPVYSIEECQNPQDRLVLRVRDALKYANGYTLEGMNEETRSWLKDVENRTCLYVTIGEWLEKVRKAEFPWNKEEEFTRCLWDHSTESENYVMETSSLKQRLYAPNSVRDSDHLSDIGLGIAMIMDELERMRE